MNPCTDGTRVLLWDPPQQPEQRAGFDSKRNSSNLNRIKTTDHDYYYYYFRSHCSNRREKKNLSEILNSPSKRISHERGHRVSNFIFYFGFSLVAHSFRNDRRKKKSDKDHPEIIYTAGNSFHFSFSLERGFIFVRKNSHHSPAFRHHSLAPRRRRRR